jgi:hypothetical protein
MDTNLIILIVTLVVVLVLYLCYKFQINIFELILEIILCPFRLLFCLLSGD